MPKNKSVSTHPSACKRKGFALILVLSLMSFVFLLIVTLVTYVGTELKLTELRKQKIIAGSNARMGLMVAMGELQKHLGPDTRVTATADLLDERVEETKETYSHTASPSTGIDLNENGNIDSVPFGQRHWTGVWKHRADTKVSPRNYETGNAGHEDTTYDSEFDGHPEAEVAWLVSGNEGHQKRLGLFTSSGVFENYLVIPDGISRVDRSNLESGYGNAENAWQDYQDVVASRLTDYDHPLTNLPDPEDSNETIWILKHPLLKSTYDPQYPENWKEHLAAEPVKVRKSLLKMVEASPSNAAASSTTSTSSGSSDNVKSKDAGSYAYWVSDEGVKTKINVVNPDKQSSDPQKMHDNLLVATEPNLEIETGFGMTFESSPGKRQNLNDIDDYAGFGGTVTQDEVRENYHSLTTDSFGVLADVRAGGLKRDLSNAFLLDDLGDNSDFEKAGYSNWLFQERVDYMKNFLPMDTDHDKMVPIQGPNGERHHKTVLCYKEKANDWKDRAGNAFIHDERTLTAGPRWSVLKNFHNIHREAGLTGTEPVVTSSSSSQPVLYPNCGPSYSFPRRKGDNTVIFGDTPPHSPGGHFSNVGLNIIQENYNYFRDGDRPEPLNHPISPVLVEVKYSHQPYIGEDGTLCLAMFPSFALWNPYNVPIQLSSNEAYELDIKINNLRIRGFNTKEWEIFKKWRNHQENRRIMARRARPPTQAQPNPPLVQPIQVAMQPLPPLPPPRKYFPPKIDQPFIDLNGNGRRDPGEYQEPQHEPRPGYGEYPNRGGGGGGGGGVFDVEMRPRFEWMFQKDFADPRGGNRTPVKAPRNWKSTNPNASAKGFTLFAEFRQRIEDFPHFPEFYPFNNFDSRGDDVKRIPLFRPLGIMPEGTNRYVRRYSKNGKEIAMLDAPIRMSAQGIRLEPGEKAYFVPTATMDLNPADPIKLLAMAKGTEAAGQHLLYKAPPEYFKVSLSDPVTIRCWADAVRGYRRGDEDKFRSQQVGSTPNGIVLYLNQGGTRRPLKKINKDFKLDRFGATRCYARASDALNDLNGNAANSAHLGGDGFRLRWKLPGTSTRMTFHEFNPRALVEGYQDGSGDLWDVQIYRPWTNRRNHVEYNPHYFTILNPKREIGRSEDGNGTIPDFRPTGTVTWENPTLVSTVPRMNDQIAYFGHFHERKEDRQRASSPRVPLFEIPRSPMLSLMQFRHANLNPYSHSPAYMVGNSYATPQVGRYKKWGRVRRLSFQPVVQSEIEHPWQQYQRFEVKYRWGGTVYSFNLYPWDETNWAFNLASIRDTDSEHNHQNITLDLSYYSNEALFDSYFLTGVSADFPEEIYQSGNFIAGERPTPFRNPRLKPFFRRGEWKRTDYLQDTQDQDLQRHQTMAGDLLVEGAFNLNSTSVEAWVSQLSALKGQAAKIRDLKDGMTLSGSEKNWQSSNLTPFLRFANSTGEPVQAPGTPNTNTDFWTGFAALNDDQVRQLAAKLVEEVKLRGPFLSVSDFVNRRVTRMDFPEGNISLPWRKHTLWPKENMMTAQGLRGPVQAAIAKAQLNQGGFDWSPGTPGLPEVPPQRFTPGSGLFHDSSYGLHAVSLQPQDTYHADPRNNLQDWGAGVRHAKGFSNPVGINVGTLNDPKWVNDTVRYNRTIYSQAFSNGEAPENLLAVENLATGANMPGWLTQADVLSPLAPVLSARSDTFVIRTFGESPVVGTAGIGRVPDSAKAWCEVTVQRVPDYVKSHVDAPHHRPHEPFADENYDGIWNAEEWWMDLNLNRETINHSTGKLYDKANGLGTYPDLPGGINGGPFKVGLSSDLPLKPDPDLEGTMTSNANFISTKGINQRFGRKFRIVKFRWLRMDEV